VRCATPRPLPWLAILVAGFAGCSRHDAAANRSHAVQADPLPVKVATAVRQDVPVELHSIARAAAYATVTVKPQVTGQIVAAHFAEGQDVQAGDLLFDLDARPFEAALREAEATLAKNTALADDAEAEAQRSTGLFRQGVATQREYETSVATAASLRATVQAARAAVDEAKLNLEYCAVRSPLAGRTGTRLADPGNVVKANESELVVINQINPIYVTFAVPEQHFAAVVARQAHGRLPVVATIPGDSGLPERGELTFIDNQVDSMTGMLKLKATFANEQRRLWPGQYVNAVLTLTMQPNAVVVPNAAVQTGQAGDFVYVVQSDNTVELRPIVAGLRFNHHTVIEQGVEAGERVVTEGQLRLVAEAKVSIKDGAATTQEARP